VSQLQLMTGNEAIAEAAIQAGCRHYYGYPITPQNELIAYMSRRLPQVGGTFIQAESELAAVFMVYGSAASGARAMTSSSSPGISLKQEGISYLAASELPSLIVNVQRGGPGLGDIGPAQGDYWQATRGGGHGDYRTLVLAPASVQESADLVAEGFDLADLYRIPVLLLTDAQLGQMMEPLTFREPPRRKLPPKDWALTGAKNRPRRIVRSLFMEKGVLEAHNEALRRKYRTIERKETRHEEVLCRDAEVILVAYGSPSRVCREAIHRLRDEGKRVGLFRPITLWPFPTRRLRALSEKVKSILVVEMSLGQMVEDVRLAVEGRCPVELMARAGGWLPTAKQIVPRVKAILRKS